MYQRIWVDVDKLLDNVNQIIAEAIEHGGDGGGAYYSNPKGLYEAMEDLMVYFCIKDYDIVDENGYGEMRFARVAKPTEGDEEECAK